MLCKAVKSFISVINMRKGETVDIADTELVNKLVNGGYVEKVNEDTNDVKPVRTRKARANKEEV